MPESQQKKLSRVRPPRVHITYDVETEGAVEQKELAFVVGVIGGLLGGFLFGVLGVSTGGGLVGSVITATTILPSAPNPRSFMT